MKKRSLTFVMSYLLLAAFIESAEAKKIDTTYDGGAGLIQLAADPSSRILTGGTANTGLNLGEPDGSMEWLLAFYYGIEAGSDFIVLENTSTTSTDEVLPTSEDNEADFSLGEEILFGYNLAGLVYGDSLLDQTAATPIATDQTSVSGSTSEKVPIKSYETIPVEYFDPPTIVYINDPTRPNVLDPVKDPVEIPVSSPEKLPETVNPPTGVTPPEVVEDPSVKNPTVEWPKNPEQITYDPKPEPGPNKVVPDISPVNSPAPVPEPATMLLFSTGIAGLAFSSLRRNKNTDVKKKG